MSELGVSLRRAWARSWRVVAQMAERCGWTSSLVRRANPVAVQRCMSISGCKLAMKHGP